MPRKIGYDPIRKETDLEITDNNVLLQILGPADNYLRLIKKAFKVKVWVRDNRINIAGTPESIEATERVFSDLIDLVSSGKELEFSDVDQVIGTVQSGSYTNSSKSSGVIKTAKKTIIPKGKNQSDYLANIESSDVSFGIGPAGCHRRGQKVLLHDGNLKSVEDIEVGDLLMGPDSTPRKVLQLCHGREAMVEIVPTKGSPWVVNRSHILTLKRTYTKSNKIYTKLDTVSDVCLADYLLWSKSKKQEHKLFRVAIDFPVGPDLTLEPYLLGVTLVENDQSNLNTEELQSLGLHDIKCEDKFIPHSYKTASRESRLALLAGLLDAGGSFRDGIFDFSTQSKHLSEDVAFLARSLGFAAHLVSSKKKQIEGTYYRICISGNLEIIPTRKPGKKAIARKQLKNVLHTGFRTNDLPEEEYFGFCLDGDQRYLLDDFTVTHNTGKTYLAMAKAVEALLKGNYRKIILCRPAVEAGEKLGFLPGDLADKVNPYLRPLYDALGDMVDSEKATELVKTGAIEVAPLAFLRGRSLNHSFILLDEAQNTTIEQMKMFLTRMGNGSKMVITGDSSQVDLELPEFKRNGLDDAIYLLEGVRGVSFTFFDSTDVVRHPLVQRIVCAYEEREERSRNYRS